MFFQTGEFDFVPFPQVDAVSRDKRLASPALAIWRCCRVVIQVFSGLLLATFVLPFCSRRQVEKHMRRWSQQLLHIIAVRVKVNNILQLLPMPGRLIVLNHISWLDVFVLNSVLPCRFVAKADVKQWPLIGFLCQQAGTLFLNRHRRRAVSTINAAILQAIHNDEVVAIFPEGTTTRGNTLKPFKSALLQSALDANTAVVPMVLRYTDGDGNFSDAPAYVGEMNLLQSIWNIASQRELRAELTVLPPLTGTGLSRAELAAQIEQRMHRRILRS